MEVKESAITALKSSPLFNLSLSSKELFHSNFLAWVGDSFPIEFGKLLSDKLELNEDTPKIIKPVLREKGNLDLIIEFEKHKVIIENKVKSIPSKDQLLEYKKKVEGSTGKKAKTNVFVLLTLIPPSFETKNIGWDEINYNDLADILVTLVIQIQNRASRYHVSIVEDYISFIRNLTILAKGLISLPENFHFPLHQKFKEIRLHDLYTKFNYSKLKEEIYKSLKNKLGEAYVFVDTKQDSMDLSTLNKVFINFHYVRGKGVITIDFSNEKGITYGIMIDGYKYLQYLWTANEDKVLKNEKANQFRKNHQWFTFESRGKSYPIKEDEYNKYGERMIYKYVKINKELSIDNLINEWIVNDIFRMQKLKF